MTTKTTTRPKATSYGVYLTPVTSTTDRRKIHAAYTDNLTAKGEEPGRMNPSRREALTDAVFTVMDALESRNGGQPDHPRVVAMRAVRDHLDLDLGWGDLPDITAATLDGATAGAFPDLPPFTDDEYPHG